MFTIRQEQTDAFRREALLLFEDRAVRHLRRHLAGPTQPFTDEQLRRRVRTCIGRSERYGLTSEQEVMGFVDSTFLLNEQFDTDPAHAWAGRVLKSEELSPAEKATILLWMANHPSERRAMTRAES